MVKLTIKESKIKQLKPLFIILGYIFIASILLNYKNWNLTNAMLDFMGLFYIVFSFFKILDIKGFSMSFRMYDPLAKKAPIYASIYPFIEVLLGVMFLTRYEVNIALVITVIVLGVTTIGVTQTLLNKRAIKCACLGTTLNLPMTEATFIENALMIIMALILLFFIHKKKPPKELFYSFCFLCNYSTAHITGVTITLAVKPFGIISPMFEFVTCG